MYPLQQGADQRLSNTLGCSSQPQPGQVGIASALQELNRVAENTTKNAYNLRIALGIQRPESGEKPGQGSSSLLDALVQLRQRLEVANDDVDSCIGHINS